MDTVAEANGRLRELGYERVDARLEPNGSADRLLLHGRLIAETVVSAEDIDAILAMLPPKAHLLAYRVVLGLPT